MSKAMKAEAPTVRLRMSADRDYWRTRAAVAERELTIAAKCVRDMLAARKAAMKWLNDFERAAQGR